MKESDYDNIMKAHVEDVKPFTFEKSAIKDMLLPLQEAYLSAINNFERKEIEEKVGELAVDINKIEETKDFIATTSDKQLYGKTYGAKPNNFINTNFNIMTSAVNPIKINNQLAYEVSDDDQPNIMLDQVDLIESGGKSYISINELQRQLENNKIDIDTQEALTAIINDVDAIENFNKKSVYNNIKHNVIIPGNLNSIVNDEMFGGRVFRNDFIEAIMTSTYDSLGVSLTEEEVKQLDPTNDGKVSLEDAIVIYGKLMENKEQTIDYVAEYFTKFAEQNRTKPNLQNQEEAGYDPYEFS